MGALDVSGPVASVGPPASSSSCTGVP